MSSRDIRDETHEGCLALLLLFCRQDILIRGRVLRRTLRDMLLIKGVNAARNEGEADDSCNTVGDYRASSRLFFVTLDAAIHLERVSGVGIAFTAQLAGATDAAAGALRCVCEGFGFGLGLGSGLVLGWPAMRLSRTAAAGLIPPHARSRCS